MSAAEDIKARLDIVAYIQQYAPLKRAGRTWKTTCLFHAEKTPSMIVDGDRQTFKCFGCGAGGDIFTFVQRYHGWSFTEALEELGKLAGVEVRPRTPEQQTRDKELDALRGLMQAAADAYHEMLIGEPGAETRQYALEKRGLTEDTLRRFTIGYALPGWSGMLDYLKQLGYSEAQILDAGMAVKNDAGRVYDRFRNRLMIPIRDERGRVVGFGARALDPNDNPKYLNSPQTALFDKSRTLFGLDMAKTAIRDGETAVIVEGYMDAIQAHQAGFTNVVAQMGTALTETQIKLLTRHAKTLLLALDSDAAGQNATKRSLETARQTLQADYAGRLSVDIRVIQIPGAKDPDDVIRENPAQWEEAVAGATPVAEYVIAVETADLPANATAMQREAVARRLLPILMASENDLYRRDHLQKLALRLHIPERDLLAWAAQEKPAISRQPSAISSQETPPPPRRTGDGETALPSLPTGQGERLPSPAPLRNGEAASGELAGEVRCLKMLFERPEVYYSVNRTFRGLAGNERTLRDGPLADWGVDDFSQTETRALMGVFLSALEQDEQDPLEYVRGQAQGALEGALAAVIADELDGVRARLHNGQAADLTLVWERSRPLADASAELLEKALRMRIGRLQREREELCFLQIDAQANGDGEAEGQFQEHIRLSIVAKGLLENELKRQMSALRD